MKSMKLSGITLATLAFPALLAGCGSSPTSGGNKKEFVIGVIGAMTGASAQLGNNAKYGTTIAVDEINAKGGINGIPVRLVVLDDEADPFGHVAHSDRSARCLLMAYRRTP